MEQISAPPRSEFVDTANRFSEIQGISRKIVILCRTHYQNKKKTDYSSRKPHPEQHSKGSYVMVALRYDKASKVPEIAKLLFVSDVLLLNLNTQLLVAITLLLTRHQPQIIQRPSQHECALIFEVNCILIKPANRIQYDFRRIRAYHSHQVLRIEKEEG